MSNKITVSYLRRLIKEEIAKVTKINERLAGYNVSFDYKGMKITADDGSGIGEKPLVRTMVSQREAYVAARDASRGDPTAMKRFLKRISVQMGFNVKEDMLNFVNEPVHD